MTHHNNLALRSPLSSLSLPPDSAVLDKPQDAALSLLLFFAWTMEPGAMAINTGNRLVVYIVYEENIESYSIIKKAYIIYNTILYIGHALHIISSGYSHSKLY